MIEFKRKIFLIIKSVLILISVFTIILFFYTAIFYTPNSNNKKNSNSQTLKEKSIQELEIEKEIQKKIDNEEKQKKIDAAEKQKKNINKIDITLKDGLFAIVGDNAVTKSDIVNEIKKILILNNMSYSNDTKQQLQQMAIKSVIENNIKDIEIKKNDFLSYNKEDLDFELNKLAKNINMDLKTLKKVSEGNGLSFSIIEDQMKNNLLWNSLIFYIYSQRVSVNDAEIEEQLKLNQNKIEFMEYLVSEIAIPPVDKSLIENEIKKIAKLIETDGFEKVAINLSISQTASRGGDLGWLTENQISKTFKPIITNTPVGSISKAIILKDGILIFKVRDIRKRKNEINPEELKAQLINTEKTKILNMYSKSHYENLKRRTSVKFLDE